MTSLGRGWQVMPVSSPRSSGWDIAQRNSMEHDKRESLCPGSSSQKCRVTAEPQKYSVMKTPANLEHKLRKTAVGPDSGLKESPSSEPPGSPWAVVPPTLPDLEQLQKLPLTSSDKQYPLMKQRGFYSDILSPGSLDKLGVSVEAISYQA